MRIVRLGRLTWPSRQWRQYLHVPVRVDDVYHHVSFLGIALVLRSGHLLLHHLRFKDISGKLVSHYLLDIPMLLA